MPPRAKRARRDVAPRAQAKRQGNPVETFTKPAPPLLAVATAVCGVRKELVPLPPVVRLISDFLDSIASIWTLERLSGDKAPAFEDAGHSVSWIGFSRARRPE